MGRRGSRIVVVVVVVGRGMGSGMWEVQFEGSEVVGFEVKVSTKPLSPHRALFEGYD